MRLGPPPEVEEEPGQFWKDFIRETAPVFRKPTIEQLSEFIEPTWRALCDGARYVDDRLREIFDEVEPDVIVEDNVVCFPAIHHSGRPWARIVSCNPLEVKDPEIPPVFSGYPAGDRTGWDEFRAEYRRATADLHGEFSAFCAERGAPALPAGRVHPRVGLAQPLPLPRRGRLRARARRSRRRGIALDTCVRRCGRVRRAARPHRRGRRRARLPVARQPRLGRRRPHEATRRRPLAARRTGSSSRRGRRRPSSSSRTTCGVTSSSRSPRSCRSRTS